MNERKETIFTVRKILRGITFNSILSGIRALSRQFLKLFESVDEQIENIEERLEPIEDFIENAVTLPESTIDKILVNNEEQEIVDKTVNIQIPEVEIDTEVFTTRAQVGTDILEAKDEILIEVTEDFKEYFSENNKDEEIIVKLGQLESDLITGLQEIKDMISSLHPTTDA